MNIQEKIEILQRQGVNVPAPATLEIGDEVRLERIKGPGTTLHQGTKLYGEKLLILPGSRLGYEEPVTVENCAVGRDVQLNGGYFSGAVFLDRSVMGKGSHVRSGTLLEEEANGAHCVGLKMSILQPFVTLGSLINFCDVLMGGGTSRRDHSEVGSSFIHFNFTPFGASGDKATPSLIGDVPRGVMLKEPRIFLGGQGGLVGPVVIEYGTVLAAGCVYRRDYQEPNKLIVGESCPARTLPFDARRIGRVRVKLQKNLNFIGNLVALWHWYKQVRLPLAAGDADRCLLLEAALSIIGENIDERIKRLGQIASYLGDSIALLEQEAGEGAASKELTDQRALAAKWPELEKSLRAYPSLFDEQVLDYQKLWQSVANQANQDYLTVIRNLDQSAQSAGTSWLNLIVEKTSSLTI